MSEAVKVEEVPAESGDSEAVLPYFLNRRYFEQILQKRTKNPNFKVLSMKGEQCCFAFCSKMFRVVLRIFDGNEENRKQSFIVKMKLESEAALKALGSDGYNVYAKEIDMYRRVLPEFRKVLKVVGLDENVFPEGIAVDRHREALILEDLKVKKFVTPDKKFELDLPHVKMSLEKLARFHAASMVVMENKPEMFQDYTVGVFSRKLSVFEDKFSTSLSALTDEVSTWSGFEQYAVKLEKLQATMYERVCQVYDNEAGDLKVLVQGDLWKLNMMFAYDEDGSLSDAIIVSCEASFNIYVIINEGG